MGTTYYANRTMPLYGSYVCSKCKSTVLFDFQIKASSASTWSRAKATEVIDEATEKYLKALQQFTEKPFLVTKAIDGRSFTTAYGVEMEHGDCGCPYCGNKEIWQRGYYYADACRMDPVTSVYLVTDVPEESRMHVFSSFDAAKAWAAQIVAYIGSNYRQHWANNPEDAATVTAQLAELNSILQALEPQKAAARTTSQFLFAQIERKEAEMKSFSLFSPERKAAKSDLKELKQHYETQRAADLEQEKRIDEEIKNLNNQIKDLHITYPGVLNEIETFQKDNTRIHIAFRLN